MKTLLATIMGLAIVVVANPASAYVVAITTSIPATSVANDTDLKAALVSAIDDVLRNAIAFSPTFVTVLEIRVVDDRIYILLLIGDSEAEEMMKKLSVEGPTEIKWPDHEATISPVTILDGQAGAATARVRSNPDATLNLSGGSVAGGIGYSWGNGTLSYNGKTYPVKIEGLSVGAAGVTRVTAKADVFNLARIEDFAGNYAAVGIGATVGGGGGATVLRNQHGVEIALLSTTQGASVMVGVEGIRLTLVN